LIGLAICGSDLLAKGGGSAGRSGSGRGSRMSRPATKSFTKSPAYGKHPSRHGLDRRGHSPRHRYPSHHTRHRHPPYYYPQRWPHYAVGDCPWCCPPWELDDLFEDEDD
jgi:hypothetical protein